MKTILITGNTGYIGPIVVSHLKKHFPESRLIGYDIGYFTGCLVNPERFADRGINCQIYGDIRNISQRELAGVDGIVHLAAISNDPMGNAFEKVTEEINYKASIRLATEAKKAGVKRFVFASSCSVYGAAGSKPRSELSEVNPLTMYAKSKVYTERDLEGLASESFWTTSLRFSTACGFSPRLRVDLVLNDFVISAMTRKKISILSDGTPWRPLIDIHDMARAIEWALCREGGQPHLVVNVGSDSANYQVKDLALKVQSELPETEIEISPTGQPDKRSYSVDFSKFKEMAPNHQPRHSLQTSVRELIEGLAEAKCSTHDFRGGHLMRLNVLRELVHKGLLSAELSWTL